MQAMERPNDNEPLAPMGNVPFTGMRPAVEQRYAGFWIRFAALILDVIALQIVFIVMNLLLGEDLLEPSTGVSLFQSLLSLVYYIVMTVVYGQTVGKMATGIKVVRADGGANTWGSIILRELPGKLVSSIILCIGYMMAGWDREKRALHDRMASTRVVKI
ncbi:RDD family protein [Paenibacillus xerothermodurans]|uniref:RDD family protein n=2 Tax=Paenibacillus xerothermodurans TaxID=1977292 RepID=A0A2W1P2F8_PAEXE|nr:RDD family protein [Paenibacillus xerothermodurans]